MAGLDPPDDAAVWQVDATRALVATVDVFTPVVDDPYVYGAVAAANSLSDAYAMAADPFLALSVLAIPPSWPADIPQAIVRGAGEKVKEAGAWLAGGHSLQDEEPKFGLVVLAWVHPQRMLRKNGLRPGDRLVLTKPLGTGTITTALKHQKAKPEHVALVQEWMMRLNREAAWAAREAHLQAGTDITGYGLLGHAWEMAEASRVRLVLEWLRIPFLDPAFQYAREGIFPGGTFSNYKVFGPHVTFARPLEEPERLLLFDAQTSGGLLLGVPEHAWDAFIQAARTHNLVYWVIGYVEAGDPHIVVT